MDNVTYSPDGLQVFVVAVRADIVKGLRGHGIAVRACKVNGNLAAETERERERKNKRGFCKTRPSSLCQTHRKVDLTSSHHIIQEAIFLLYLKDVTVW